jgi:LemA protein
MKNNKILPIAIGILALLILIWFFSAYNGFVNKDEAVRGQWAQVETQYQRRMELIPNLVSSVRGYAQFESGLLQNITESRSRWMDAGTDEEKINAANEMDSAISRLLFVYESYPELRTIEVVASLMDELAGTENRISVERKRYNDAVQEYNVAIKRIPGSIVAGIAGFEQKQYFISSEGADKAPDVEIY